MQNIATVYWRTVHREGEGHPYNRNKEERKEDKRKGDKRSRGRSRGTWSGVVQRGVWQRRVRQGMP